MGVIITLIAQYVRKKNDIPVLQNLDVRWPIMHFTFYSWLPDAVHAFCNKRAMLRYPALVRRDAVNELRGCVTYNQRSKWGPRFDKLEQNATGSSTKDQKVWLQSRMLGMHKLVIFQIRSEVELYVLPCTQKSKVGR